MEFIISRNNLLRGLTKARAFSHRARSSILSYRDEFILTFNEVEDSVVNIHVLSDFGEHIVVGAPLDKPVVSPRNIAVHYRAIMHCIKTLEEQPLHFIVGEYQIKVIHSCGSFGIPLETDFDFCLLKNYTYDIDTENTNCFRLEYEAPGLRSILNRCKFAMAHDELRPALNGVYFNYTPEYSDYVSSDGHRLVRVRKNPIVDGNIGFIIPYETVSGLLRILPNTGNVELDIRILDDYVSFVRLIIDDNITLYFKPVQGRYPNYLSVIPDIHKIEIGIDRKQLIKSIDRLLIFADGWSKLIKMTIEDGHHVRLNVSDKAFTLDGEERLPCDCRRLDGTDVLSLLVGFNGSSLSAALKNLPYDNVAFHIIDPSYAVVIQPQPQPDVENIYILLMPMLIN